MRTHNEDNNRKPAIRIEGVSKKYRLGIIGGRTLQEELQSWWAKKRGKEDPTVKVDVDQRTIGQEFWALKDIDLTIYKGERIGIIGVNGAGKSTLLKILSRVTAPTEGDIYLYGKITSMLEVGTGFHGEMTGRENIYLNGAILGMSQAEIDKKMDQIIEFSEVGEFIDTPVKRYSSGMFVKLAFSVAAHLNSEIMIMDEVLAVGDYAFQKKCLKKMRETASDDGRTILYVSHNMETIRNLCERCIVLKEGRIIYDGDVEEAIALYIGRKDQEEAGNDINLDDKAHMGMGLDKGLLMRKLSFDQSTISTHSNDESLDLTISVEVVKPLKNVRVKLGLSNTGTIQLGTAWSKEMDFDRIGEYPVDLNFPLDFVGKGKFSVSLGFYTVNDEGRSIRIDSINDIFFMNIKGVDGWSFAMDGYFRFPEIEVQQRDM